MQWDGVLEDLGGAPPLRALVGLLLLCVLPRGAFLLCGSVLAGCAWGYLISPVCAKVGVLCGVPEELGGEGTPAACGCAGSCRCVCPGRAVRGEGPRLNPRPCVHVSVCSGRVIVLCVCVSAVGRGAVCAAGRAGLPACSEDRGSSLCVCAARGRLCFLCSARVGGWHSQGIRCCVLCLSIRVIRMRTCSFMIL